MKTHYQTAILALAALFILSMVGVAVAGDTPQVSHKEGIGNYLADGKGMTLYYITKDKGERNACAGPCLEKWPIYYSEQIKAPAGSDAKDFGEFTRADGKKQSTFKGWPLYYFAGDKAAGDTNGQGLKDVWFVINPITIPSCF
jgi:predicted lipoprotein with Yx(FWY)xxD motif